MSKNKQILIRLSEEDNDEIENALNKINFNKEWKSITNKSEFIRQLLKLGLQHIKTG